MTYALKALSNPDSSPNLLFGRPDIHWRERYVLPPSPKQHSDYTYTALSLETLLIYNYIGKWTGKLLGINIENDEKVRNSHFYDDGTPNESLSIAILNLSKPKEVYLKFPGNFLRLSLHKIFLICVTQFQRKLIKKISFSCLKS